MQGSLTPDLCVLGGGHGAAAIAASAASLGMRTVLVRGEEGDRQAPPAYRQIHALAAAAAAVGGVRRARGFGFGVAESSFDFAAWREGVQKTLADLALNESGARLQALGVTVLGSSGRFVDPRIVVAGDREISARRFLVVPTFTPVIPDIRGLPKTPHLTAARMLDLREIPRHLVVIGAGATGLSLAQSFRRFGAEVTVLEKAEPLAGEDRECMHFLLEALKREGIRVLKGADVERVSGKRGELRVAFRHEENSQTLEATHLLVAAGWQTDVESLALDLAGIEAGSIGTRSAAAFRTGNPRVYMAANGPGLPQADAWYARLVLANLMFRLWLRPDTAMVARATATDPAIAHVGLGEAEARERYGRIRILRWPFAENEAALFAQDGKGMIKLVTTERGRLVGATMIGRDAAEMIAPYALALSQRMHLSALTAPLFPHATRGEIGQQAVLSGMASGLTGAWVRRIIAYARSFR